LYRVGQETGCSNPWAMVQLLQQQISEEQKDNYSLETILNRILGDECISQNKIETLKKAIRSKIPELPEPLSKQEIQKILPKTANVFLYALN
jgi:hypothetical protein